MKERPILMSAPMVRAILDGRKTQTRRAIKDAPSDATACAHISRYRPAKHHAVGFQVMDRDLWQFQRDDEPCRVVSCPYGVPGDRLWVRETWAPHDLLAVDERDVSHIYYRADDPKAYESDGSWKPSIHMPRWASRITLEVVNVRVERLQDISGDDCRAEGIRPREFAMFGADKAGRDEIHRINFRLLWDDINGAGAWDKNPWVWVVEFKRLALPLPASLERVTVAA